MIEPKLRFKADDGSQFPDWEEKTLGDMTVELQDYVPLSSGYPLMTSSRTGLMMQNEFRSKSSTDDSTAIFSVVPRGVATYRHMSDDDIFHFNINNLVDKGLVSKEYPVFNTKDNYNLYLLVEYLNSSRNFLNFCKAQKKGGTRTRLYFKVLKDFKLNMPSLPEQQKIVEFLSTIDTVIEKQKETVSAWEERKKGVMQKLFNQEVRFKADDGSEFPEWEKKKIGDVFDVTRGYVLPVKKTREVSDNEYKYPVYSSQTKNNGLMGFYNQKLYENAITWTTDGANAGKTVYRGEEFYCTNVCGVLLDKNGNHNANDCIANMIDTISKKYVSYVGNPKLMNNVMSEIEIDFPCPEEQQKIADCLSSLDEVIEKQKATLAAWEEMKKGLLQQMFV